MLDLTNKDRRFLNSFYKRFQLNGLCKTQTLCRWTFKFFLFKRLKEHKPEPMNYIQNNQLTNKCFCNGIPCAVICAFLIQQRTASTKRITCNFVQIVQLFTTKKLQSSPCSLWFIPKFLALFPRQECRVQLSVRLANKQCTVGELGRRN